MNNLYSAIVFSRILFLFLTACLVPSASCSGNSKYEAGLIRVKGGEKNGQQNYIDAFAVFRVDAEGDTVIIYEDFFGPNIFHNYKYHMQGKFLYISYQLANHVGEDGEYVNGIVDPYDIDSFGKSIEIQIGKYKIESDTLERVCAISIEERKPGGEETTLDHYDSEFSNNYFILSNGSEVLRVDLETMETDNGVNERFKVEKVVFDK